MAGLPAAQQYATFLNMKKLLPFIIVIVLLAVLAAGAVYLWSPKQDKQASAPEEPVAQLKPEFAEGTFVADQNAEGVFTQSASPVEISLQRAKEGKSVAVSWDASKVQIFHLVLLNTDWQAIWLLSSLDSGV